MLASLVALVLSWALTASISSLVWLTVAISTAIVWETSAALVTTPVISLIPMPTAARVENQSGKSN